MNPINSTFSNLTGVITLVPNNAAVQRHLARLAMLPEHDSGSFSTPALFTLSEWVFTVWQRSSWLRGMSTGELVPAYTLQEMWESAMAADTEDLLPEERKIMASQAITAERQLRSWVPRDHWSSSTMGRGRFQVWRSVVNRNLDRQGLLTSEQILGLLTQMFSDSEVEQGLVPSGIRIEGFAELTRLEEALLDALQQQGVSVEVIDPVSVLDQRVELLECESLDEELRRVAQWSADMVDSGKSSIAVVINGLDALAGKVCEVFEDEFHPEHVLGGASPDFCKFQIGNARTVGEHPVVQSALLLLQLSFFGARRQLSFDQVSRFLLNSNWEGSGNERMQRARLEHRLREDGIFQCSLARLSELASSVSAPVLSEKLARIPRIETSGDDGPDLITCLGQWGWPDIVGSDRHTNRVLGRFGALVLDVQLCEGIDLSERLRLLAQLCRDNRVSGGGGALSPVQVVSPHDAYGHTFDAVALVNFHADVWPPAPAYQSVLTAKANQFIPRSSVRGQFKYAKEVIDKLLASASVVRASWARSDAGTPQVKSYLLPDIESVRAVTEPVSSLARRCWPESSDINGYKQHPWLRARWNAKANALAPSVTRIRGFAAMLELQSGCPLAAFFRYRLDASFESTPQPFASPAFSGQLVHLALEYLYRPSLASQGLPSERHIPAAVEHALEKSFAQSVLAPAAFSVEQRRLEDLLKEWLELESLQPVPDVIALELPLNSQLAGFEFTVRIDRVDRLANDSVFILDYKTGSKPRLDWTGDRLLGVQLPLYAWAMLNSGMNVPGGVGVAIVRANEMGFKGVVDCPDRATKQIVDLNKAQKWAGNHESFEQASRSWGSALSLLATEFRDGDCSHVYYRNNALAYTGLEPLMRKEAAEAWLVEQDHEV